MIARTRAWVSGVGQAVGGVGQSLADWMEERTGVVTMLDHFLYEPVPKRGKWLYTLGSSTLFLITLQFLTGILLLFYYVPTAENAWDSIYYIMTGVYFGPLIRGIHFWSANVLVVVIGLHMVRTFFSGSYKRPREINWVVGVVLILLVTVLAFTGYALRWDQEGFWAWEVGIKIGSYSPFVGEYMATFLLGGDTVGPATLSRVFVIDVWLLPALLAPFIGIHLYLLRKHGEFGSEFEYTRRLAELRERKQVEAGEVVTDENVYDRPDETMGFFPGQVLADLTASAILLAVVVALSYLVPAPLTEPMDLSTDTYVPRPEWFFMFYDQMLMFFPGYALIPFGGIIIPTLIFVLFFAIPWLDKEPGHSPLRRPFVTVVAFLVILTVVINMLLAIIRILNFPGGSP